mgnify:CR=1 FL=1
MSESRGSIGVGDLRHRQRSRSRGPGGWSGECSARDRDPTRASSAAGESCVMASDYRCEIVACDVERESLVVVAHAPWSRTMDWSSRSLASLIMMTRPMWIASVATRRSRRSRRRRWDSKHARSTTALHHRVVHPFTDGDDGDDGGVDVETYTEDESLLPRERERACM